jgi:serine/threonine-protein kinase
MGGLSLSPDGSRIAVTVGGAPGLVWVYDLRRDSLSKIAEAFPLRSVWIQRGERIVYASGRGARAWNLSSRRADAAGEEERLSTSDEVQLPLAVSPDGRWLVYVEGGGPTTGNLFKMPPDASAAAVPLFPSRVWGTGASFSPDGRWLAYESTETGRSEIYVRPFPEGEQRFQLSTGGGESPVWSRGGEVVYFASGGLYAVAITIRGDSLAVSKPVLLFRAGGETHLAPIFDVMPDGQRFIMLRSRGRQHVSLILNWSREIARLETPSAAASGP